MGSPGEERLEGAAPTARGGDIELHPVFGHRPPCEEHVLRLQTGHDLLIFKGMNLVFLFDHPADHLADSDGRQFNQPLLGPWNAGIEEELQFENALRAMEILVRSHAADRGFMHLHVFGDVPKDHRVNVRFTEIDD